MTRSLLLLLFQVCLSLCIAAQNSDTLATASDTSGNSLRPMPARDSNIKKKPVVHKVDTSTVLTVDTTVAGEMDKPAAPDTAWLIVASAFPGKNMVEVIFSHNTLFPFSSPALAITSDKKLFKGKELMFYALLVLLLLFALIRTSFSKYLSDLFQVAFRTTLKQRQIGEQLIQTPLPSLLLNLFFLVVASLYINFILQHYSLTDRYNFWLVYLYCFVALSVIYIIKFLSLKLSGWLFNISETTDDYIFIVFMINKIIGIYLLPFLVLLAFTDDNVYQVAFALSYLGVFALYGYRIILSYSVASSQARLHPFHFFLYLCAFEIVPLLVIYKALVYWF